MKNGLRRNTAATLAATGLFFGTACAAVEERPFATAISETGADCSPLDPQSQFSGTIAVTGELQKDTGFMEYVQSIDRQNQTNICLKALSVGSTLLAAYNKTPHDPNFTFSRINGSLHTLRARANGSSPSDFAEATYLTSDHRARVERITLAYADNGTTKTTRIRRIGAPSGEAWWMEAFERQGAGTDKQIYSSVETVTDMTSLDVQAERTATALMAAALIPLPE